MSNGLAMFDANGRLAVWNERYVRIYRMPPGLVRQGANVYDIVKFSAENGKRWTSTSATFVDRFRRELAGDRQEPCDHLSRRTGGSSPSSRPRLPAAAGSASTRTSPPNAHRRNWSRKRPPNSNSPMRVSPRRFATCRRGSACSIPDQRVVVANARYAEIYRLREDQVKPGTTLREILQAREAERHRLCDRSGRLCQRQRQTGHRDPGARRRARHFDQAAADVQRRMADHP